MGTRRRQLDDDEIVAVREKAREVISQRGSAVLDWGTKEFAVDTQTVSALLFRPPESFEHTYEDAVGVRLLEFHGRIAVGDGDDEGLVTVRIETASESNEPEIILVDAVKTA